MSHSVKVTLIADQEIKLLGDVVNIHDISSIVLNSNGYIIEYGKSTAQPGQGEGGNSAAQPSGEHNIDYTAAIRKKLISWRDCHGLYQAICPELLEELTDSLNSALQNCV